MNHVEPIGPLHLSLETQSPFACATPNPEAPDWNLPVSGGSSGGLRTGTELGMAVLKQRRSAEFRAANQFQVADMVASLMVRARQVDPNDFEACSSLEGQMRGFIMAIVIAADHYLALEDDCHAILDKTPMEDLLALANEGLEVSHWENCPRQQVSTPGH